MYRFFKITALLLIVSLKSFAQEDNSNVDADGNPIDNANRKGFNVGLYMGSLFANKYTATIYDGYGFDPEGKRNSFENSFMYNKIILEYGGGYGQQDQIAEALGVQHDEWSFNESDMPVNMKYSPSFLFGLQFRYSVDKSNAILFNVNGTQLNITGNFTITTTPTSNSTQINDAIKTCTINGVEKRIVFQLGYQRLLGESPKINFLVEGGLNVTMAKYDKNEIMVGDLRIDLASYFYQPGYASYNIRKPVGVGFGAFGGLGINLNMAANFKVQLVYNPSYEAINIGPNPRLKFQHAIGLRVYYSL